MSTPVEESALQGYVPTDAQLLRDTPSLEQRIADLEQRIARLEQLAHSEHTIGTEAVDQLAKQVIQRIGNGLVSLVQTPE